MEKSIFDSLTELLTNERLDETLLQNPEYIEIMDKINQLEEQISECGIAEDTRRLIGALEGEYLTLNACYGKTAYQQGFKDCAALLTEVGMINRKE